MYCVDFAENILFVSFGVICRFFSPSDSSMHDLMYKWNTAYTYAIYGRVSLRISSRGGKHDNCRVKRGDEL